MHDAVRQWVARHLPEQQAAVVEFGSLDINGGVIDLLNTDHYVGIDMQEGPGVDIVADAATYEYRGVLPDVVLCLEVFEHTPEWPQICQQAARILRPGGIFIGTAATSGRPPHSARRESPPDEDEHYANILPTELGQVLSSLFPGKVTIDVDGFDIRWVARCKT